MGPGGFTVKYGMYPHTVLLELLCETGLAGTLPLLALLLLALCKMVIISKSGGENLEIQNLLLFFLVYALQANISGTLWQCSALLAALGYALALPMLPKKLSNK